MDNAESNVTTQAEATQSAPRLFNRNRHFPLKSTRIGKSVTVRFPTDAEILERQRKIKILSRSLGGGRGSMDDVQGTEAASAALMEDIYLDGDKCDPAESAYFIARLFRADIDSCERIGDAFDIRMTVLGGAQTRHVLKVPTVKQSNDYADGAFAAINRAAGVREIRVNPEKDSDLYNKLEDSKGREGYESTGPDAVPLCHKSAVISRLHVALSEEDSRDVEEGENFQ